MPLAPLRATQLLAAQYLPPGAPGNEEPSDFTRLIAAFAGCRALEKAYTDAFLCDSARRDLRPMGLVAASVLRAARLTDLDPRSRMVACKVICDVLSRAFAPHTPSLPTFNSRVRDIAGSAAVVLAADQPAAAAAAEQSAAVVAPAAPGCTVAGLQAELARRALPEADLPGLVGSYLHVRKSWDADPLASSSVEDLRSRLDVIASAVEQLSASLPEPTAAAESVREAADLSRLLALPADGEIPAAAFEAFLAVADLGRIRASAQTAADASDAGLPSWIWPGAIPEELRSSRCGQTVAFLNDLALRDDLVRCLDWRKEHKAEVDDATSLATLAEPTRQGTLVGRLGAAWDNARQLRNASGGTRERVAKLSRFLEAEVNERLLLEVGKAPSDSALLERAEQALARFEKVEGKLHLTTRAQLHALVSALAPSTEEALADVEKLLASTPAPVLAGMSSLGTVRYVATLGTDSKALAERAPAAGPAHSVTLSHPVSRPSSGGVPVPEAAELVWSRRMPTDAWGMVRLPLRLTLSFTPATEVILSISVDGESVKALPAEATKEIEPAVVTIPARPEGEERPYLDIELSLPMTEAFAAAVKAKEKNLTLGITVSGPALSEPAASRHTWTELLTEMPVISDPFHQAITTEEMLARPLGVEKHFADLLAVLERGDKSFVVLGPRRHGKSTLLRGATERMRNNLNVAVMPDVTASGKSLAAVWGEIREILQKAFKRVIPETLEDGLIPPADAYDEMRQEAWKKEKRTVYILIDEAQALFANDKKGRLAERLKERLEKSWGLRTQERAAVLVGFVGQPQLERMITSNLGGALSGILRAKPIADQDLRKVLREDTATGGMRSTPEARRRLSELSGNIYVLDKLLQQVREQAHQAGRCWFIESHVEEAAARLVTDDSVWRYMRDFLNTADDLEKWAPGETFPVAMAWARALSEGVAPAEVRGRVDQILQSWMEGAELLGSRVTEAVQLLKDQQILLNNGRFAATMLERVLAERAKPGNAPLQEEDEREALARLCLEKVKRPPPMDFGDGIDHASVGGQAKVYPAQDPDNPRAIVAVRCVRLESGDARRRFFGEIDQLDKLSGPNGDLNNDWNEANDSIPRLIRCGLCADDPSVGVVIYQWIPGEPLRRKKLSEEGVASVGARLAAALELLASLKIVHRDIRPENVIIRAGKWSPVLIDFGLAREVEELRASPNTVVGEPEFIPPEVSSAGNALEWDARGDIYALGKTLLCALRETPKVKELAKLLATMTDKDPRKRPHASVAKEIFVRVAEKLESGVRAKEFNDTFDKLVEALPEKVRHLGKGTRVEIHAARFGFAFPEERCVAAADFLSSAFNVLALEFPDSHKKLRDIGSTLIAHVRKLGKNLPDRALNHFRSAEACAVGKMRNAKAHPETMGRTMDEAYRELSAMRPTGEERKTNDRVLRQAINKVAKDLDTSFASRTAIGDLIHYWADVQ